MKGVPVVKSDCAWASISPLLDSLACRVDSGRAVKWEFGITSGIRKTLGLGFRV